MFLSLLHAQGLAVELQQGLLLIHLMLVHLPDADDLAHDLGLETRALGLLVHVPDGVGNRFFLVFQPLDALDELAQVLRGQPQVLDVLVFHVQLLVGSPSPHDHGDRRVDHFFVPLGTK